MTGKISARILKVIGFAIAFGFTGFAACMPSHRAVSTYNVPPRICPMGVDIEHMNCVCPQNSRVESGHCVAQTPPQH